jgi:hypothetical protein
MIFLPILFKYTPEFIEEDVLLPTLTKFCDVIKTVKVAGRHILVTNRVRKAVNLKLHQNVILGHGQRNRSTATDTELS